MNLLPSKIFLPINIEREFKKTYLEFQKSLLNLYKNTKDKDYIKFIKEVGKSYSFYLGVKKLKNYYENKNRQS